MNIQEITGLKREREFITRLFQFSCEETELQELLKFFTNYIKTTKADPIYFILLLDYYSHCRPKQRNISKELFFCLYSCFPDNQEEIQTFVQRNTNILKFIINDEEYQQYQKHQRSRESYDDNEEMNEEADEEKEENENQELNKGNQDQYEEGEQLNEENEELFSYIQKDDIDSFLHFQSKNQNNDFIQENYF